MPPSDSDTQRIALVTGANRGLGRAIAEGLARRGLHVLVTARRLEQAEAAVQQMQERSAGTVEAQQLDVTDQGSVDRLMAGVVSRHGRLDVLVNNAGAHYDTYQQARSANLEIVRAALEINLVGAWRMCLAVIPLMKQNGYGRIVNMSSGAGAFTNSGGGGIPAYRVSKAGLNMLTDTLGDELANTPIFVNAACPGWVRTDMGGPGAPLSPEEGADTPIWLATLPPDGPSGGFFRRRERIPW